jgi:hypothetical protein
LWEEAGAPDFWDVTPNDGNGFCTCDDCMALDEEYGHVQYTKNEVWNRPPHVTLTGRYAWFWNQLLDRMKPINPQVQIGVYLYGAYRDPPEHIKLNEGIVGEMVSGFDFEQWRGWEAAGIDGIALRPNWLYMGAGGPHLPLEQAGDYLALARDNGMMAISLDCFHEYWATQGPYYYLLTRMVERPDLSKEAVLEEYALAFGAAAPAVRDYLDFWSKYSREVAWNIPAGGRLSQDSTGIYERRSREVFGEPLHPLKGHWLMMPYIYTPEKLAAADTLLVQGQRSTDDPQTRQRLEYLRDGLRMVEHVNAYIGDGKPPFADEKLSELQDFRSNMQRKYDYWNSMDLFFLAYWGVSGEEVDLTGM